MCNCEVCECAEVLAVALLVSGLQNGLTVKVEDDPDDPTHANLSTGPEDTIRVQEEVVMLALMLIRKNTLLAGTSNIQARCPSHLRVGKLSKARAGRVTVTAEGRESVMQSSPASESLL